MLKNSLEHACVMLECDGDKLPCFVWHGVHDFCWRWPIGMAFQYYNDNWKVRLNRAQAVFT